VERGRLRDPDHLRKARFFCDASDDSHSVCCDASAYSPLVRIARLKGAAL
jgi:hypothetical protein